MNKKDDNMEWELEASHLASLPRTTPFNVPAQYFDDLTARINQSVFVDGLMQKEDQGFTVPQNYFEDLGIQIESRIALAKIKSLVNNDGFKTPANYFDKLNAEILSKTSATATKTKVVRLWSSDLMKYASAACFILLAATGLYLNEQNSVKLNRSAEIASEQMLYDIDESVILEHIQESQNVTSSSASDKEIENYILENYSTSDLS
ncbi:MAG: hypothetical protein EOP00_02420, partial [Pedobacter sp.]